MTADERHALLTAPLPKIRVVADHPRGAGVSRTIRIHHPGRVMPRGDADFQALHAPAPAPSTRVS